MKTHKILLVSLSLFLLGGCYTKTKPKQEEGENKEIKINSKFHLMAHRGGVTDGGLMENSLAALDEAIKRGYTGVEIDVRESKDGVLFLYHNRTFERDYESTKGGDELTWDEIQKLVPKKEGDKVPVTLETYLDHCKGKIKDIMVDIKIKKPSQKFYMNLEDILVKTDYLKSSYFIGHGEYFKGKAMITMLMREKDEFFKNHGERTKDFYFLFTGFDEINSKTIRWANANGIKIIACVNRPYIETPDHFESSARDAKWLIDWGVVNYQIDSEYDVFFR